MNDDIKTTALDRIQNELIRTKCVADSIGSASGRLNSHLEDLSVVISMEFSNMTNLTK